MTRRLIILFATFFAVTSTPAFAEDAATAKEPIKVGWLGAMSGPMQKYGAYNAALIAQDDVNEQGGINGRPLQLIFEDGKCESKSALAAAQKLINVDKVKFLIGGHCTPESAPVAHVAEISKVLMLAAITTSPKMSKVGDYFFRLSPVSLILADKVGAYVVDRLGLKKLGVVYSETDYVRPVAEHFAEVVRSRGAEVVDVISVNPADTDYRPVLTRLKRYSPDGVYFGAQSPEMPTLFLQQMKDLGIKARVVGNEITGVNGFQTAGGKQFLYEGVVTAEPSFSESIPETKAFVDKYRTRFNSEIPYGVWSAEAYDAVKVMSKMIAECGMDVEKVRECLSKLKNYRGASGLISINENHDGVKEYVVKMVKDGKVVEVR